MKRGIRVLGLLSLLALYTTRAHATTSTCTNEVDGTPCSDTCIAAGLCMSQVCVPSTPRPDGTLCSTGDACTTGDHCQSGMCVSGGAVTCPNESSCKLGACSSQSGCYIIDTCRIDMGPPPGEDLAGTQDLSLQDLSSTDDLAQLHDLSLEPNDMCVRPPGVEFYSCTLPDGGTYIIPFDAGVIHVRGSAVGDCALSVMPTPPPWSFVLMIVAVLLIARRRTRKAPR